MKSITQLFLVAILVSFSLQVGAQQGYELIESPQRTANPDKVEVVEFFWYGCPHCFRFEPHIAEWKKNKPDNVEFINAAPPLNPAWKVHSQAFYAAQVMGVLDKFHEPMFNAIHVEKKRMRKAKDVLKLVDSLGLDSKAFGKTMKSFAVDSKIRQSLQMASAANISAVPTVIVNGKYRTSGSVAGSNEQLIVVLNELIAKESAEMASASGGTASEKPTEEATENAQ